MTNHDPAAVPEQVLHDVRTVLAGAVEYLARVGWRRDHTRDIHSGARLIDALNYASAQTMIERPTHHLVFASVAMAIQPHTTRAAHTLLPDYVADEYLSPHTPDERLHHLDAQIVTRYNSTFCSGYEDAKQLTLLAYELAPTVIAAQTRYARVAS